jgi:hypothetical protein
LTRAARAISVLIVAVALGTGGVAAAATTTSTTTTTTPGTTAPTTTLPATPTTVAILPPPPPFTPGDDFGRLLLDHRKEGTAALAQSSLDIAKWTGQVSLTREHLAVAQDAHDQAIAHARAVKRKLVAIHDEIKVLAADAYMMGSSVQLTGALSSFTSAHDVLALTRNLTLVRSSHDRLHDLVDYEQREQARAGHRVDTATQALADATTQWQAAETNLAASQQRVTDANAELAQADRDQVRFFADATTSASPIMGPSRLTAADLVAYVDSLHLHPHLTVPLLTLAGFYISEGNAEGVRGDVAFAQSILETGAFMFPGHGLLVPTDNNFAGIDACDSCKHGDLFATAQLGVRAQIQLLRVYADPSLKDIIQLAHPVALLHEPHLKGSGHSRTWYSLGGTWATGPNYGFHVYDIYMKIVALSERPKV